MSNVLLATKRRLATTAAATVTNTTTTTAAAASNGSRLYLKHSIRQLSSGLLSSPWRPALSSNAPWLDHPSLYGDHASVPRRWVHATPNNSDGNGNKKNNMNNLFAILGLEPSFAVNETRLKQTYRHLMTRYHPDKQQSLSSNTTTEGESSKLDPSLITLAYDTLKDPHSRATHLIEIIQQQEQHDSNHDGDDDEDETALLHPDFLAHIMTVREDIESATSNQQLEQFWKNNESEFDKTCHELEQVYQEWSTQRKENQAMSREVWKRLRQLTAQLQYWHRIQTRIKEKMDT